MDSGEDTVFSQLYQNSDFSEVLDEAGGLLANYEKYSQDRSESATTIAEQLKWKNEANTWKLIRMLTSRRWQQKLDSDMPTERPIRSFKCDLALANEIMETDFKLAEIKTVKDWLEEIADEFEPCELKHTHLQSTLDHITVRTRDAELGISKDLKTDVVTELDPDSMTRQKKNLVADDLEYEQQLNKTIFKYLRSGRLQDALEFCRDCHQFYKAATLQGGLVHCDPIDEEMTRDVDDPEPRQKEPMGNQNRSLWKAACLQLACDSRVDHYERAIYGALAGDVQSVLSVCNTWEDYLWAYFNGIIESRLQKQLCSSGNQMSENKTSFTLPLIELSENQVFERLMEKENLQKERNEFYHLIQKHCIIGEYGNLFQYFNSVLDQFPMNQLENTFSLRFLAHFILLWRNLEFDDTNDLTQRILLKYIDYLIASENGELVPMFYEPLPRQVQTVGYATFLSNLQDDKTKFYKLGQSFRLNMREICVETVRMITGKLLDAPISLESSRTLSFTPISQPLTEEDSILISSLAWFTFETEQIKSLFEYCNKLLRRYLILGKLNCVKWIMDHYSLSSSEIDVDDWAIDPVFQTEQTDYFSLIACVEAETNWRNLQAKKPIQDTESLEYLSWKEQSKELTLQVSKQMLETAQSNTLGSFVESFELSHELSIIRAIYVPWLILSTHEILFANHHDFPSNLQECFNLAQLVAKEGQLQLVKPFLDSDKLSILLEALKETALASLSTQSEQLSWPQHV